MSWLRTPLYLLQALAAQIPALRAGEALQGATEAAVGAGNMEKSALSDTLALWRREALGHTEAVARVDARDRRQLELMTADLGIPLEKVPSG